MDPKRPLFPIYDIMEHWAAFAFGTPEVKPQHHALYLALVQQCKVRNGMMRFAMAYQHGMQLSGIGSKATYLAALKELELWGFLTYTPGANGYKTPIVEVRFQESTGNLLDLYRYSYWESTGHNKEVIKLEGYDEKAAARIEELEKQVAALKAQLPQPKPVPAAPALSDDLKARLAALTDTSGEIIWSESILSKPDYFAKTARKLVAADVDLEHYRRAALIAAEAGNVSRDIKGWESWVSIYFTNQLQRGPLLTLTAAALDLSQPTPKHLLPPVGTDCTGRHIVLPNTGDANMNRMFAANYQRDFPNAIIHQTRA